MRAISSVKITVLPSPAPPKRPILPPRTNGVSRSTTLMPVSNTSVLGERLSNGGGSRWIGQRSEAATGPRPSIGCAQQVEDPAQRLLAHRHRHRPAGVDHRHPADQAVGRAQGHAPHPVAAELLLDLAGQVDLDPLFLGVDRQGRCRCRADAPRRTRRRRSSRSPGQSVRSRSRWPWVSSQSGDADPPQSIEQKKRIQKSKFI